MTADKIRNDRLSRRCDQLGEDLRQQKCFFRIFGRAVCPGTKNDTAAVPELAGIAQLGQHTIYPVSLLTDILQKQDLTLGINFPGGTQGSCQQGEVAAAEYTGGSAGNQRGRHLAFGIGKNAGETAEQCVFQPVKGERVGIGFGGGHGAVISFLAAGLVQEGVQRGNIRIAAKPLGILPDHIGIQKRQNPMAAVTAPDAPYAVDGGIGKGTVYEYFSSKEEIIVHASLWICFQQNREMAEKIEQLGDFQSKFMFLLEWMLTHKEQNKLIMKALKGSFPGECDKAKELLPEGLPGMAKEYITSQINNLFDQGYQEGVITQQDVEKRMIVFFGTMMQYSFGLIDSGAFGMSRMNVEEHKQFAYECMIKALN